MKMVVDRIEGKIAVCENVEKREMIEVAIELLPKQCKEGSVILYENGEYLLDIEGEEERQQRIKEKMKKLWD